MFDYLDNFKQLDDCQGYAVGAACPGSLRVLSQLADHGVQLSVSPIITVYPDDGETAVTLISRADEAIGTSPGRATAVKGYCTSRKPFWDSRMMIPPQDVKRLK